MMKHIMQKAVSLLLVFTLLAGLSATAFAKETVWISQSHSDIPLIRISGDGEMLFDEDGNKVFHYKDALTLAEKADINTLKDPATIESIVNLTMPLLINGLLHGDWDPFYSSLQTEIGKLFERSLLDPDGNPQYGSGLHPDKIAASEYDRHTDKAWRTETGEKYYTQDRYWFHYDWRLDPIESAAEFKSYIDDILEATGCEQAGILASCLGTNVVTAYLAVYPEHAAQHIRGVAYDGSVVGGAEILSEAISGKFNINAAAVNRLLLDSSAIGLFQVDDFVNVTMEMLERDGIFDLIDETGKKTLYYTMVEGVTPPNTFAYPAELYYYANSRIRVSDVSKAASYTSRTAWADVLADYATGPGVVALSTRSIAIENQLNYGVSLFCVYIKKSPATPAPSESLFDAIGAEVKLVSDGATPVSYFPLTGVMVSNQYSQSFKFEPTDGGPEYVIYDNNNRQATGINLLRNTQSADFYTIVFPTPLEPSAPLKLVLEFENQSSTSFVGYDNGMIHPGTKFYLVGEFTPTYVSTDPVYMKRVFTKDYMTTLGIEIQSLENAYNIVPDLNTAKNVLKVVDIGVKKWTSRDEEPHPVYNW